MAAQHWVFAEGDCLISRVLLIASEQDSKDSKVMWCQVLG